MSSTVQYNDMKDSGIKWIGTVPSAWDISRIGSLYSLRNEKVSDKDFPPLSVTMKGIVPQLATAAKTNDGDNRKLVRVGDFVINSRSDRRGSCGISPLDGSVSLINTVLTPLGEMNPGYYNWLFHTSMFADEFYQWGHGIVDDLWTTRWQEMKQILVPVPPLEVQSEIAIYLDDLCGRIDSVIEDVTITVEKYKSWKASLIYETVTRGLRKKATYRDTNVEWIGDAPRHWNIRRLHQLVRQVKNKNSEMQEKNLLSLSYGKIKRKDIKSRDGLLPASFDGYNIIEKGDIVLRLTDLQNDHTSLRVGLSKERGIITSAYVTIRPINSKHSNYLYYILHSFDLKKGFYGMGSGVRQGLNFDEVKELLLVIPPEREQEDICAYLDDKCSQIDSLITEKESLITDLLSYRKSLIYETVMGRRKVV